MFYPIAFRQKQGRINFFNISTDIKINGSNTILVEKIISTTS